MKRKVTSILMVLCMAVASLSVIAASASETEPMTESEFTTDAFSACTGGG